MNGSTGRIIQMGDRVDAVNDRYPDDDPGSATNAARIKSLVKQAHLLLAQQRAGLVNVHASSVAKKDLRRAMSGPLAHLSAVGRAAAADQPELGSTYRMKPSKSRTLDFQTAVGTMVESSQAHRDLLVAHGLAVPVLDSLVQLAGQFGSAVTLGSDGRASHVSATRQLKQVAAEIARIVRVMDARNRQRFQDNGQALGEWISASTVLGVPRGTAEEEPALPPTPGEGGAPAQGNERPAA